MHPLSLESHSEECKITTMTMQMLQLEQYASLSHPRPQAQDREGRPNVYCFQIVYTACNIPVFISGENSRSFCPLFGILYILRCNRVIRLRTECGGIVKQSEIRLINVMCMQRLKYILFSWGRFVRRPDSAIPSTE
jgi:hypothetical protein